MHTVQRGAVLSSLEDTTCLPGVLFFKLRMRSVIIIRRQFKVDSQRAELLPEAVNTRPPQGRPVWMLIHKSYGASEGAGTAPLPAVLGA